MKEELVGFKVIEEFTVKCGDCNTPLAEIQLIEDNASRQGRSLPAQYSKFKVVECPKCNGSSFETKVFQGKTIVGPVKTGFDLEDVSTDVVDGVIVSTFKVRKV